MPASKHVVMIEVRRSDEQPKVHDSVKNATASAEIKKYLNGVVRAMKSHCQDGRPVVRRVWKDNVTYAIAVTTREAYVSRAHMRTLVDEANPVAQRVVNKYNLYIRGRPVGGVGVTRGAGNNGAAQGRRWIVAIGADNNNFIAALGTADRPLAYLQRKAEEWTASFNNGDAERDFDGDMDLVTRARLAEILNVDEEWLPAGTHFISSEFVIRIVMNSNLSGARAIQELFISVLDNFFANFVASAPVTISAESITRRKNAMDVNVIVNHCSKGVGSPVVHQVVNWSTTGLPTNAAFKEAVHAAAPWLGADRSNGVIQLAGPILTMYLNAGKAAVNHVTSNDRGVVERLQRERGVGYTEACKILADSFAPPHFRDINNLVKEILPLEQAKEREREVKRQRRAEKSAMERDAGHPLPAAIASLAALPTDLQDAMLPGVSMSARRIGN